MTGDSSSLEPPASETPNESGDAYQDKSVWTAFSIGTRSPARRLAMLGLALEGGLLVANYWIFHLFGEEYFRWYLVHGGAFALVFALISSAVDLDRYDGLVAVAPGRYLAAWMDVVGSIFSWWSTSLGSTRRHTSADILPAAVIAVVVSLALIGWVIVIAPVQYLVTLLCGAPARLAIASDRKFVVTRSKEMTVWSAMPVDDPTPEGATEIGFRTKPVTLTNAIAAGVLWGASFAL